MFYPKLSTMIIRVSSSTRYRYRIDEIKKKNPLLVPRHLKQQAALAEMEEEKKDLAKQKLKAYEEEKQKALEPEYARMWSLSVFATVCPRPTGINVFDEPPNYARVLGQLTFSYLEAVSFYC